MTKTKVLKATDHFIVTAMAALLLLPPASANERIRTLGKDTLGETLKEFRTRYPKATCGRGTFAEINHESLAESRKIKDINCCLNDKDSLNVFSLLPILTQDDCVVQANFWKNRLWNLSYVIDVRTVEIVLPTFDKLYGPPHHVMKDSEDPTKLFLVEWSSIQANLELRLTRFGGLGFSEGDIQANGEPWLRAVSIVLRSDSLASR